MEYIAFDCHKHYTYAVVRGRARPRSTGEDTP